MNATSHLTSHAATRSIRTAQIGLGWVVVFLGFHIYWYAGGSFASPGTLPGEPHRFIGWVFQVFVVGAFALGLLAPLAIARGWERERVAKPVAVVVWLGAGILILRGLSGVVDDLTRATGVRTGITGLSTKQATGMSHLTWPGWAIDSYFLIGGAIFIRLALCHRRTVMLSS